MSGLHHTQHTSAFSQNALHLPSGKHRVWPMSCLGSIKASRWGVGEGVLPGRPQAHSAPSMQTSGLSQFLSQPRAAWQGSPAASKTKCLLHFVALWGAAFQAQLQCTVPSPFPNPSCYSCPSSQRHTAGAPLPLRACLSYLDPLKSSPFPRSAHLQSKPRGCTATQSLLHHSKTIWGQPGNLLGSHLFQGVAVDWSQRAGRRPDTDTRSLGAPRPTPSSLGLWKGWERPCSVGGRQPRRGLTPWLS